MNNRRGELKAKTLSPASGRTASRTARSLTQFAEAGEVSKAASYDGLKADDLLFVEIS